MWSTTPLEKGTHPAYDLLGWEERLPHYPTWFWVGIIVIIVSELLMFLKIEPVYTHFTLIVWWGYILCLDGFIKYKRGVSFLADRPGFFIVMAALSLFWWLVFEFYNCYLENWVYIGLPENIVHRYVCYTLSFATITPAILLTYELFLTIWPSRESLDLNRQPSRFTLWAWFWIGLLCITVPLLIPNREVRHYLFGFVWVGFVFWLEPVCCKGGGYSLIRLWCAGGRQFVWLMFIAGAICGLLWEFWNYWAGAKWLYTVPVTQTIRYFEMPLLGFLGFLPFAWECLVLIQFSLLVLNRWNMNPHCTQPTHLMITASRGLFVGLLLFFILTYTIHDKAYFPMDGLQLSNPSITTEQTQPSWMELSDKELIEHLTNDTINLTYTPEIKPLWSPDYATPEVFNRLARLQKDSNDKLRRFADFQLRNYALSARFNWANVR